MSIRYGISLIPEPRFAARAYRARQLICGQYACWAAEMHMLQLPLVEYFEYPDDAGEALSAALGKVLQEGRGKYQDVSFSFQGVTGRYDRLGDIYLDLSAAEDVSTTSTPAIHILRQDVLNMLAAIPGIDVNGSTLREKYNPRIYLMQHADLPDSVFESSVAFAAAVVQDLDLPSQTRAWQAVLLRFESAAAGENWLQGGWAPDLSWKLLASYPI